MHEQNNNEYIVEYFDFPSANEAVVIGQLFQGDDLRKKYTTRLVHKLFSLLEQFSVIGAELDAEGKGVQIEFMKGEYADKLRERLGNRFILGITHELLVLMRFMNIKSFKRNLENPRVKEILQKTDTALLAHLNKSLPVSDVKSARGSTLKQLNKKK